MKPVDVKRERVRSEERMKTRKYQYLYLNLHLYLNSQLLFHYFIQSYLELKVKYKTYWQRIRKEDISFAKLGLEECDVCLTHVTNTNRGIESKFKNDGIDNVLGKLINDVKCAVNKCNECSEV